jgi:hypothetical protein
MDGGGLIWMIGWRRGLELGIGVVWLCSVGRETLWILIVLK